MALRNRACKGARSARWIWGKVACSRGRVREVGSARECPVRFAWRKRESERPGRPSSRCAKGREGSRRGLEPRENAKKVGVRARGSSPCHVIKLNVSGSSSCDTNHDHLHFSHASKRGEVFNLAQFRIRLSSLRGLTLTATHARRPREI